MAVAAFPYGADVKVSGTAPQSLPAVAALAEGGFVLVWSSQLSASTGEDVLGMVFTATGDRVVFFPLLTVTRAGTQTAPSVATLADGGFVLTWSNITPGGELDVYARRFDATGLAPGPEFLVNASQQAGAQVYSSVTGLSGGGFVIVWQSPGGGGSDIWAQRYLASGAAQGAAFQVLPVQDGNEQFAAVAALGDGGFLVSYTTDGVIGFQQFDSNGIRHETPSIVSSVAPANYSSVVELLNGHHVVVWSSDGADGSGAGVFGQIYSHNVGLTGAFRINQVTNGDQTYPSIAALQDGGFLVTWSSQGQDGSGWGVYGRRYDADGGSVGSEFRINATTDGDQLALSGTGAQQVATLSDGTAVQVFTGPDREEVFYRLISTKPPVATDDAYVIVAGSQLTVGPDIGLLTNDVSPLGTTVVAGSVSGTHIVSSATDGSFAYAPGTFTGIDDVTYSGHLPDNGSTSGHVKVYVVPVNVGATSTTLNLVGLTASEQIAATYAAFFGRAADADGFDFWVDQFNVNKATQSPAMLFANIASSFGISNEAKSIYPFLANPSGASDDQILSFIATVYNNLFNRIGDNDGLAYWAGQIKATLQAGKFVGSVLVDIMSGAQNTQAGSNDITTLMSKVTVSLHYVDMQKALHATWVPGAEQQARALLDPVSDQPSTLLVGIAHADQIAAMLAAG